MSPPTLPQRSTGASPEATSNRHTILLADDDAGVRDALQELLSSEGYLVIPAANGEQAVELATAERIDLAILDVNMPVKTGWDALEHLTVNQPLVPVIVLTARPNQLFRALGAGVAALLEKPVDCELLLQTVQRLIQEPPAARLARSAGRYAPFEYRQPRVRAES